MSEPKPGIDRRTLLAHLGRATLLCGLAGSLAAMPGSIARASGSQGPLGDVATGTVVSGIGQPNHIIADGENIYWTELTAKRVFIRKAPRAGGAATTLFSEPAKDRRGLTVAYVQLKQNADTLFWSRQSVGYYDHWSIISIPKAGGDARVVLREDASVEPMYASKWAVTDSYVAVVLADPAQLELARKTVIARQDLATREWSTLLSGRLKPSLTSILAATSDAVYVRGVNNDSDTEIGSVAVPPASGGYQQLASRGGVDRAINEPATTDGTNLYFWSRSGGSTYRLQSLPLAGGAATTLYSGALGYGLTVENGSLFFARDTKILRGTTTGTAPVTAATQVFRLATLGGIPVDSLALYHAVKRSRASYEIRAVAR